MSFPTKGIRAEIYSADRNTGYDPSNGGISSRARYVTVLDSALPELSEPTEDAPAVILDSVAGTVHLRPVESPSGTPWMYGGAFVSTSDSRFQRFLEKRLGARHVALALHDRTETWADYDALTR